MVYSEQIPLQRSLYTGDASAQVKVYSEQIPAPTFPLSRGCECASQGVF
jgi:hypothetical protein